MVWRAIIFFFGVVTISAWASAAQQSVAPPTNSGTRELLDRVVANQRKDEEGLSIYERIERLETRKLPSPAPPEIKISRTIPAGTGIGHLPVGEVGKAQDLATYRAELEKLERSLAWAAEDGRAQREAYEKIAKKQKERRELIDATKIAFLYTEVGQEMRADRLLTKFRLEPNPEYKPTSRATSIFSHVQGYAWIDEQAGELARIEVEVTEDISIGGFLAKIYKGSHFMQERYEMVPGLWFPSYSQYDFDGRKLFLTFSVHERTFYSQYHRIGPPKEALSVVRAELEEARQRAADP